MNHQIITDATRYIRQELNRIHQDLTWADGTTEEKLRARQSRLQAELDRMEALNAQSDSDR